MKAFLTFILFYLLLGVAFAGVERFLKPIQIIPQEYTTKSKANALIRRPLDMDRSRMIEVKDTKQVVTSHRIETMLADSLKHRFQVSGDLVVKLASAWDSVSANSNFILKLAEVSPDELSASSFIRFSLWDAGEKVGEYGYPVRIAQMKDIYVTSRSIPYGAKLNKNDFKLLRVDVLKQHANSVPSSTNLSSFQLDSYLAPNTPLKWNNISKANLIKKGQVVDVFASGKGIYVTMKGLALEDGAMDAYVKIKNLSSDKEFHAKVLSENSVKVAL